MKLSNKILIGILLIIGLIVVSVPIHELNHYNDCINLGGTVIDVSWFQYEDGTLGYVVCDLSEVDNGWEQWFEKKANRDMNAFFIDFVLVMILLALIFIFYIERKIELEINE